MTNKSKIINKAEKKFLSSLRGIEEFLIDRIIQYLFDNYRSGNRLKRLRGRELTRAILNITNSIKRFLNKDAGYEKRVADFIGTFNDIDRLSLERHLKLNNLPRAQLLDVIKFDSSKKVFTDAFFTAIDGQGLDQTYIEGLKNVIINSITRGVTFEQARQTLLASIPDDKRGAFERYAGQVAKDALNQYDGVVQDNIRREFDLTRMMYIGGDIKSTRPFCDHLTDIMTSKRIITSDELQESLDEFIPEGNPSDELITYTTAGKKSTKKKGSGMIAGTTFDSFTINRGGYQCRHEAIWVR